MMELSVRNIIGIVLIFLVSTHDLYGQQVVIEGTVVDAESGQPLAFATIGIRGTSLGTATNSEGNFIISIPAGLEDSVLFCSYMGYKNFELQVKKAVGRQLVRLDKDTFTLDEVEIRPWQPWDYIWNAMQKIPENYPEQPFMTRGYYSEYMSENDVFLKFTEGVIETYNPAYGSDEKSQSRVIKARRGDDLGMLQFMRKKLEKKYARQKRKASKKGEEWEQKETIDEEIISASFGGPEEIISADPLRDTAAFLNPEFQKKFRYEIDGYTRYFGEQIIIIGFDTKGKYDHQRMTGKIYISLESDAIIAIEYDSELVIPAAVRPLIFVFGFGITNPEIHAMVHYKQVGGRWLLNDISIEGGTRLTDKKMFKKNDRSEFYIEMALINNQFDMQDVHQIAEDQRIDGDKPLEEQVEADPDFWQDFKVSRPSRLVE